MEQYISKDAIIAEIEKLILNAQTKLKESEECKDYESYVGWAERIATCINILSLLDTFEVKEVDLEEEFYDFLDTLIGKDNGHLSEDELFRIAEYFFELGLKAQKGE